MGAEKKAAREAAKAEKAKAKEMAKEKAKAEKARLLAQRKSGFFGSATGKSTQRRTGAKKYKTVRKSYVNAKGMFVTEDVRVTDDEADEGTDRVEVAQHKGQVMQNGDGEDAVMTNKENSAEQQNGQKKAQPPKKKAKAKKVGKSPKPKKAKSGNIMNFFKAK